MPADGRGEPHRLLASEVPGIATNPSWSPDGKRIAFHSSDADGPGMWIADVVDPGAPWDLGARRLSRPGSYSPTSWAPARWSPDSTRIATSFAPGGTDVWDDVVIAADGSGETVLWPGTEDDGAAEWSPDGTSLSILHHDGPGGAETDSYPLYLIAPDGSDPRRVDSPPVGGWYGGAPFSPDGTRVIAISTDHQAFFMVMLDGSSKSLYTVADGSSEASWQPVVNSSSPMVWATVDPSATFQYPNQPRPSAAPSTVP